MAMIRPETEMKDSGIQWIGDIPNDWDVRRLKYVLNERKEKMTLWLQIIFYLYQLNKV